MANPKTLCFNTQTIKRAAKFSLLFLDSQVKCKIWVKLFQNLPLLKTKIYISSMRSILCDPISCLLSFSLTHKVFAYSLRPLCGKNISSPLLVFSSTTHLCYLSHSVVGISSTGSLVSFPGIGLPALSTPAGAFGSP